MATKKSLFNDAIERGKRKGKELDIIPSKKLVRGGGPSPRAPHSSKEKSKSSRPSNSSHPSYLSRSLGASQSRSMEIIDVELRSKTNQDRPSKISTRNSSHGELAIEDSCQRCECESNKDLLLLERPPRRALPIEKDHRILPLNLSQPIEGRKLVIDPGLLDTDSLNLRGVAHRLIYGSILPQDESDYFRDLRENMDITMKDLTKA